MPPVPTQQHEICAHLNIVHYLQQSRAYLMTLKAGAYSSDAYVCCQLSLFVNCPVIMMPHLAAYDINCNICALFYSLHQEIRDFHVYMSPQPEEHYMRQDVVHRITNVITSLWPNAKVSVTIVTYTCLCVTIILFIYLYVCICADVCGHMCLFWIYKL